MREPKQPSPAPAELASTTPSRPATVDRRAATLLELQQRAGNSAVVGMIGRRAAAPAGAPEGSGSPGAPLPATLARSIERLSGQSMDDVRVHADSARPARLGAEAYTQGSDVYLGPGKQEHLAHEAWHVAQQKQGRVRPELALGGMAVNADEALEREADVMARRLPAPEAPALDQPLSGTLGRSARTPVVQGVFTKSQLRHIQKMRQDVRIEYLSHLSKKDLDEVAEATNLFERFGGSEESDELRGVRAARRGQPEHRQWLGTLPAGNVRQAARQLAHVGGRQPTTLEESEAVDRDVDVFLTVIQKKVNIAFVEDCPLDDSESTKKPGPKRMLVDHDVAFTPPVPGKSLYLMGTIIAWREDPVAAWKEHLRAGVKASGATGDLPGRYGAEPEDDIDELSALIGSLSIGPTGAPPLTSLPQASSVSGASTEGGLAPMDVDDDAMDVDVAARVVRIVLTGLHLPPPSHLPPDGVVSMDIDADDVMDVETENPFEADVEMADAEGTLDVTMDESGAVTAVYGSVSLRMELDDDTDMADVVVMDIDLAGVQVAQDDGMDLSTDEAAAPMEVDAAPRGGGPHLDAAFLRWREPKKRKIEDDVVRPLPVPSRSTESDPSLRASEPDEEVEALTERLADLQISFTTDLDDNREQHQIGPNPALDDILVASNPVPLKTILAAKKWLGQALAAGVVTTLTTLCTTATAALKKFAKSRTKGDGMALRTALRDLAKALKHVNTAAKFPKPDLTASTNYGSNSGKTEGVKVVAKKLSMNMKDHYGHGPTMDGRLMTAIRKRAGTEGKSYKQMHLLNDNVFGPGELWNLTPGPALSNSEMEHGVETHLKRAVIDKALVFDFEANVRYRNDPMAVSQGELDQDPDKYRFDRITFSATQYDWDGTAWTVSTSPDPDIKAIGSAASTVYWKWGSLTPLRAKPSILSTTDEDELTGIMSKGLAQRLVALNDYNAKHSSSPYTVTASKDKKGALLAALKQYEIKELKKKSPKVVGWDKWKATEVLWN
jgi:hypothetical protein